MHTLCVYVCRWREEDLCGYKPYSLRISHQHDSHRNGCGAAPVGRFGRREPARANHQDSRSEAWDPKGRTSNEARPNADEAQGGRAVRKTAAPEGAGIAEHKYI